MTTSPKTLTFRSIKVVPTFLGTYTTNLKAVGSKQITQLVRDNWTVGQKFKSRDGRNYVVANDGSLRKN